MGQEARSLPRLPGDLGIVTRTKCSEAQESETGFLTTRQPLYLGSIQGHREFGRVTSFKGKPRPTSGPGNASKEGVGSGEMNSFSSLPLVCLGIEIHSFPRKSPPSVLGGWKVGGERRLEGSAIARVHHLGFSTQRGEGIGRDSAPRAGCSTAAGCVPPSGRSMTPESTAKPSVCVIESWDALE